MRKQQINCAHGRYRLAAKPARNGSEVVCVCRAKVVTCFREDGHRMLRDRFGFPESFRRFGRDPKRRPGDATTHAQGGAVGLLKFLDQREPMLTFAKLFEDRDAVEQRSGSYAIASRQERERTPKQIRRVMGVASQRGSRPCGGEPAAGAALELWVSAVKLPPIAGRRFQVIAQHFVDLGQFLSVRLEPVREALVQLGPHLFRQGMVGSIAKQQVPEAESLIAGEHWLLRMNQLLTHEADQRRLDLGRTRQLGDGAPVEDFSLDRASLDHRPLGVGEQVEACLQQRLHCRRCADVAALADEREHLLHEQRVSAG